MFDIPTGNGDSLSPMAMDQSKAIYQALERFWYEHKREAFVMAAMQGLCANPGGPFQRNEISGWSLANCSLADLARTATDTADATLAQLEKCDEAG